MRQWRVAVERSLETETSLVVLGRRDGQPVVLKVVKPETDEWHGGDITAAFDGKGVVRVYEHTAGATLLERASPGTTLAEMSMSGRDDDATGVLADVIASMSPGTATVAVPTVRDWATGFESYTASGDQTIPSDLVAHGARAFLDLCGSQSAVRLLHGDLHHYNVLLDERRGWLAIDPKGVIGELEYEIGAALRNPYETPELLADPATISKRVECYAAKLHLDAERILGWAFAQAVLAAAWAIEDGFTVDPQSAPLALATAIRPML